MPSMVDMHANPQTKTFQETKHASDIKKYE